MMSLNDLCLINCKQGRSVGTHANDETNHKIWFLSVCHPNVVFFCTDMKAANYEDSQDRGRYFGWSSYNTQTVIGQVNIRCQTLTIILCFENHSQLHIFQTMLFSIMIVENYWRIFKTYLQIKWQKTFKHENNFDYIYYAINWKFFQQRFLKFYSNQSIPNFDF